MLIFFLGQTYAIIAPVLLPACALFFAMFTVVWRHNVVYHYRQRYVAGGNLWPWIVRHVVFSVIFFFLRVFRLKSKRMIMLRVLGKCFQLCCRIESRKRLTNIY